MSSFHFNAFTLNRKIPKNFISTRKCLIQITKRFQQTTASAAITENVSPKIEWNNARPFEEIPSLGVFESIRANMPGGKYYKKEVPEMLRLLNKEYGNVVYVPGIFRRDPIIMTFDPNDFETVFRNEGTWPVRSTVESMEYHRKIHRADVFKGVEGLVTTQGEQWGKFRSAVNPVLMQPRNVLLHMKAISQINQEFIEKIRQIRDPKTQEMPADFGSIIKRWALESVSIFALDKQLGLLKEKNADPLIEKFFNSINEFNKLGGEVENRPSVWRIVATPKFKRLMKSLDNILYISFHYINEAMERIEKEKKNGIEKAEHEQGMLEKLLKVDPQIAKAMAMDMLMAGADTVGSTFIGTMLCLSKNPEKQEKLREEVRRVLPNKDSDFTEKSLNDMSYLRACIKESLRLYPLVVGNFRRTQRDIVISGYKVPKGTNIRMLTTSANFDEKYYPSPKEFIPERWLRVSNKDAESKKGQNALKSNNPFVYLPFGFGPRSCIGRRISDMELELCIARIIRNFNVSFNYPTDNVFKLQLFSVPNIPLKFQMIDVDL